MSKLLCALTSFTLISLPAHAGFLDDLGKAMESTVKQEVKKGVDEALAPEPTTGEKTTSSNDTAENDLWNEVRFQWGKYVSPDTVTTIKHDVTCDGHQDYVATHLNQDNPDGPFYNVMIVTKDGGKLFSEHISLPFDGSQSGLCEPIDQPDVTTEIEHWDEGQLDGEFGGWEGMCTEAIRVDDGMCDAFRYFWLTGDRAPEDPKLMSHRN